MMPHEVGFKRTTPREVTWRTEAGFRVRVMDGIGPDVVLPWRKTAENTVLHWLTCKYPRYSWFASEEPMTIRRTRELSECADISGRLPEAPYSYHPAHAEHGGMPLIPEKIDYQFDWAGTGESRAHRVMGQECDECHGTGYVQLFASTQPCSRGCTP